MNIFDKIISIEEYKNIGISGMTDEFFCVYLNKLYEKEKTNILIVTSNLYEANNLVNILSNYNKNALLFPMDDFLTSNSLAISPDLLINRLETINSILDRNPKIVVTHLLGYLRFLPTIETYKKNIIYLKVGETYDLNKLKEKFFDIGYVKEALVTKTGEVGIRGFIIDFFGISEELPCRIEFFGDTIESIRYFDPETQKSIKEIDSIKVMPNTEFLLDNYDTDIERNQKNLPLLSNEVSSIQDYLEPCLVVYRDFNQINLVNTNLITEMFEYNTTVDKDFSSNYMFDLDKIKRKDALYYMTLNNLVGDLPVKKNIDFKIKAIPEFKENIQLITEFITENLSLNKTIIVCLKEYQIKTFIKNINLKHYITTLDDIHENSLNIVRHNLTKGFIYNDYVFISDKELFNIKPASSKFKTSYKYSNKLKDINKLNIGDYVVHETHGIGVYNGIKTLVVDNLKKDYIELLYLGNDKLYIPVEKITNISKYSGKEGFSPKISRLGGTEWEKTKQRVKNKVKDIAKDLIHLYAERESRKGYSFSKDTEYQKEFESEFEYIPTKDQLVAIEEIKKDMESPRPMDRLLCGDVGYGKTEVAFRAIFKAIMDSKQVLYLCPTTILSIQQYQNALARFKNYPINIALLNRFVSKKEASKIISNLNEGKVDLVIGTHRLLSDDIKPKDLGLLIIDEEQRFGVVHKEKIKKYKSNVDVLTLTATPIPRTLQMSLIGIRSLSLIETPPSNRFPIQTYVIEENDQIIKDAIYKELARNGQVFILYNYIKDIEEFNYRIQLLVPEARIVFVHGQMSKEFIEKKMLDFIDYKYDILICTTIIETGIDIPNVNTLIVIDADHFGLSQLYQIRGRVGRSDRIAYSYLMYKGNRILGDAALKRLNAIKEFTELGSGFSIANRDLSIRGAGDILGSEQAGFIDTVGIDLYLKILNDEIKNLKGETVEEYQEDDSKPLLNVETHISNTYTDDTDLKIEIHQKINKIDSYEKLLSTKQELEDRFGKLDESIIIYMYEEWLEKLAKKLEVERVIQSKNYIEIIFNEKLTSKVDGEKLFYDTYKITPMFKLNNRGGKISITLNTNKLEKHYIYYLVDLFNLLTNLTND